MQGSTYPMENMAIPKMKTQKMVMASWNKEAYIEQKSLTKKISYTHTYIEDREREREHKAKIKKDAQQDKKMSQGFNL